MSKKTKLLISVGLGYVNSVVNGISLSLKSRPSWLVRIKFPDTSWSSLIDSWHPDAIITEMSTQKIYQQLKGAAQAVINVSGAIDTEGIPVVHPDDVAIGQMAAEYFLDLKLKNFAFWGLHVGLFAKRRKDAFFHSLMQQGIYKKNLYLCPSDKTTSFRQRDRQILNWLKTLPKPIGILTSHDSRAYYLNDIARLAEISIPDQIALLGVDNDPQLCELSRPSLSSIMLPTARIGQIAVEMADDILSGRQMENNQVTVEPIDVVSRGSTEMLAVDNPDIVSAISYIRNSASENLSVNDMLKKVPISRRKLEILFKKYFNRTPGDEIRKQRLNKARQLLATTKLTMPNIARKSGFSTAEYMRKVFSQTYGISPRTYRKQVNHMIN